MKNTFAIVTLASLLTGCAGPQLQSASPKATGTSTIVAAGEEFPGPIRIRKIAAKADAPQTEDVLPSVELTNELLFNLLSAEIASARPMATRVHHHADSSPTNARPAPGSPRRGNRAQRQAKRRSAIGDPTMARLGAAFRRGRAVFSGVHCIE